MNIYWVPCATSYSFPPIVLKLFRCFLHGMKMCMCFGYNPLIIFSHFFCFVNLVVFQYEMLSKCIDSGYLVGATPPTVFHQLFWNIAGVFSMEWRCACGFGMILYFLTFSAFYTPPHKKWRVLCYILRTLSVRPSSVRPSVHQHFVSVL